MWTGPDWRDICPLRSSRKSSKWALKSLIAWHFGSGMTWRKRPCFSSPSWIKYVLIQNRNSLARTITCTCCWTIVQLHCVSMCRRKQDRLDGNTLEYKEFANLALPAGSVSNSGHTQFTTCKNLALNLLLLAVIAWCKWKFWKEEKKKSVAVTKEIWHFASLSFKIQFLQNQVMNIKLCNGGSLAIKNVVKAKEKHVHKQLLQLFMCGTF